MEIPRNAETGDPLGGNGDHALLWGKDKMTDLGAGDTNDINDRGQIVGESNGKAILWDKGLRRELAPGAAAAINNRGVVAGASGVFGPAGPAFVWKSGKYGRLPSLGGGGGGDFARDVNDAGQIVGESRERAVIWLGGRVHDLNRLIPRRAGWVLFRADAINNRGQIVGFGEYKGKEHGFLLTPR